MQGTTPLPPWLASAGSKVLLVAAYISLNISLNMINKWTLTGYGFSFPITLSIVHQLFSFTCLTPFMITRPWAEAHQPTVQKQWMGLLAIAAFFSFNLGANNVSLLSIPLSLNQVIRACIPVATALGATFIERKPPNRQELASLLVLVTGVAIAIWEGSSTSASVWGCILCMLGTLSNGFMMSSIGKLLSDKLDVWRLTWYCAPLMVVMLLPFYLLMEAGELHEYRHTKKGHYMGLVGLGCVNALAYNLIHSLVIKVTSSVTATVVGEAKIVLILVLSSVWLGESDIWSARMLLGVLTALIGFGMYTHAVMQAASPPYFPVIKGMPELPPSLQDTARGLQRDSSNSSKLSQRL